MISLDEIMRTLSCHRFKFKTEAELQVGIMSVIERVTETIREHRLSDTDRPDFFLPQLGLAIEVKTKGAATAVLRQLSRYASHVQVQSILLITSRIQLATTIPDTIEGKPVRVHSLAGSLL